MPASVDRPIGKRRIGDLMSREDILAEAKSLSLNASQAAEAGIVEAIRFLRAQAWREANREGIAARNARVERDGVLLTPDWADE